ncbi:hypothetical protein QQ045_023516 [Rhodiola kirilowii]
MGIRAEPVFNCRTVLEVEGKAILQSMVWATKQGISHCIFETDSAEAFSIISLRRCRVSQLPRWALRCIHILESKAWWRLSLVRREANLYADSLAKLAKEKSWRWNSFTALPRLPGVLH